MNSEFRYHRLCAAVGAVACAAVLYLGAAPVLRAQETQFYTGIDIATDYVSNGISQTNGKPALQAHLEVENSGFYAGTWMSNVDFANSDNAEIDLYLGYRSGLGDKLFVDLGYARYLYDSTGDCCGEIKASATLSVL
jgi:uncharacterized protein (TIGR02001 family)